MLLTQFNKTHACVVRKYRNYKMLYINPTCCHEHEQYAISNDLNDPTSTEKYIL